jgi:dihydroorotase
MMAGAIIIKNGRVVDPAAGLDKNCNILIEGGRFSKISEKIAEKKSAQVIDAKGLVVTPGFIDLHVHFREPGYEYKETIETGAKSAAAGGFTSVCCMANTSPVNDNGSITKTILEKGISAGSARVYPIGAVTKGMNGKELAEIGEMKEAGAVAISDDGRCVTNPSIVRNAMEYGSMFGLTLIEHCEDESARGGIINEGEVSARYGLKGIPSTAESVIAQRNILLSEYTGIPVHLAHISVKETVDAVRAAKGRGIKVTCEAAPHHFTLTEKELESFDTNCKMNPPLRTQEDVTAIKAGLADGTIDCIATDHAPHAEWEKETEIDIAPFGIVGLETALPLSLKLVSEGVLKLIDMVALLTSRPAAVLNLPGGKIAPGEPADITIFDPDREWVFDPKKTESRGKNSPFNGATLKGQNLLTIVGGNIVYNSANL